MTIKKLQKDIEEIKHHMNGQIPDKSQQLNQLSYQISCMVAEDYPKYREAIKDVGDYIAITPGLCESLDKDGNIKLDGKFDADSPEAIHLQKLEETCEKRKIEAIDNLSDEKKKIILNLIDKKERIENL